VFIDWVHEITDPASAHHAKVAPPERYAEVMQRASRAARAGHIPGAVNVPRTILAASDGALLPPESVE
jgi:3-mercaptopyruvate sulfurtransferase SseA